MIATASIRTTKPRSARTSVAPVLLEPQLPQPDERRLFAMLLDESPLGVLVIDGDGRITFANLAISVLFPLRSVLPGSRLADQPGLAKVDELAHQAFIEHRRVLAEVRVHLASEDDQTEERVYSVTAAPLEHPDAPGVWIMVNDVTDHVMTEQIRKDFVTNASHELRTPLSLIHGYIETLKSGMIKGTQSLQRCLDVMDKHSKRMMRIIEDMLTISRLESADPQLKAETFLVRGCVEDALEHLTPLIEQRQPAISVQFPERGGMLNGDRFYWDQIFSNLIENALKENQATGLRLTISGEWTDLECILRVSDNGIGIAAEDVPFVFNRFYRCAKHHGSETKGTGLGLSIVKRAVDAHGGLIELLSEPGVCTTFTIRLPFQK